MSDPAKALSETKIILSAEKYQGKHQTWSFYFFTDKAKKQIIAIQIFCCRSLGNIYIFYKDRIPAELIEHYEFLYHHKQISKEPHSYIKERIKNAFVLEDKYFITKKRFA